ncbi:MAG TPA: tripartite tricarboxylate transporter substrate binding protein [Anaerolineaceae bacterium]
MKLSRIWSLIVVVLLFTLVISACTPAPAATQAAEPTKAAPAYPERDITLIIQSSPGGGSDLFARTFANAVTNNKLLPVVVAPENMPGASGAVAYAYVAGKAGDPYFLLNASGTFITTPILGQGTDAGNVTYKNFTPVAALALDEMVIAVKAEGKYATLQDVIDAAKAAPDAVLAGGTELGSPDSICYYLLEKETGADFNYIVFDGGDEVNAALLGGNVDVAIGNPGDFMELYKGGKVKLIGSFSETRLASLPEVPTVKEQGIDAIYQLTRGFAMPSGVPAEAVVAIEKAIQDYMKTPEWKAYVTENSLTEKYMDSATFIKFLEESTVMHTEVLKAMGVIK